MTRLPTITWIMTIIECLLGYWVWTLGASFVGGLIVGLAVGTQMARISRALFDKN